jgi:hypothetical protein
MINNEQNNEQNNDKKINILKDFEKITKERKIKTVIKRNGKKEEFVVEHIFQRMLLLKTGFSDHISVELIVGKILKGIYDGIETCKIDSLAAETCAYLSQQDPEYSMFATRIAVENLHKTINKDFAANLQ